LTANNLTGTPRVNGLSPATGHPVCDGESQSFTYTEPGLTKRELLAAMAMQAVISNEHTFRLCKNNADIALASVKAADALLVELAK
jgi:hypothetical protein